MISKIAEILLTAFGVGFGGITAVFLWSYLTDRPRRIVQFRQEGYDNAVEDIVRRKWYWDRKEEIYKNVEIREVPNTWIDGERLLTFFNRLYNYHGDEVIKTIERAVDGEWRDAEPINQWREMLK